MMSTIQKSQKRQLGVGGFTVTPKMREYVNMALDAGRISYGSFSKSLETRFAALHQSKFGVLSNSGTSSLQVALQAMKEEYKWADGDEVIVPSVTFVATINVVLHNRMKPIVVDIEDKTYGMDPAKAAKAINKKTRAIIPAHLFGQPCNITDICTVASEKGLKVIEDSCEAVGATQNGKSVGSFGQIGCFSFYVAHIVTAGVGGIAITSDPALASRMRSLVNHGRDGIYIAIDDDQNIGAAKLQEVISKRFSFVSVGHSYRITEMEAALAFAQIETDEDWNGLLAKRSQNAEYLLRRLQPLKDWLALPQVVPGNTHSWMMFPLVLWQDIKWPLCNYLEQQGIETREMLPLIGQPCYQGMWRAEHFPMARWVGRGGFYVGCGPSLSIDEMDYMAGTIKAYFRLSD